MGEALVLLRSERPYRRLLSASLISGVGDWFNSVTLLSLLLHLTGSGLAVGLSLAARTLPYLVVGPIAGSVADRFNRKTILVVSDFVRAGVALSFLFVQSASDVWVAYAGTVLLIVFSAFFSPARTAVIPQLVEPKHLLQANSLEQATFGLVMALGSALGGVVIASFGTDTAFLINSASFLISGLMILFIPIPSHRADRGAPSGSESNPSASESNSSNPSPSSSPASGALRTTRPFWAVFRQSRLVQVMALQALLWPIGGGVINVLLSIYGYQTFHGGNTGVGVLYGALGLGFLISGFMTRHFTAWLRKAAVIGFLLEGVCHVLVSQAGNLWTASILLVIATIGAGVGNAAVTSLLMQAVPTEVHGRLFALFDTISSVILAGSMMAAGVLLNHLAARTLGLGSGLLIVMASAVTGALLLRLKLPPPGIPTISIPSGFPSETLRQD